MSDVGRLWDELNDPQRWPIAASTIEAFRYVLKHHSPEQVQEWLERRRPDERVALRKLMHDAKD
jgi:hypothetical protein